MLIVEKYGGSSVATTKKIKLIAKHIKSQCMKGNKLVVVVSAMGKTTNKLIELSKKISKSPNKREQDVLLCTGEMQTISLLCMALCDLQVKAISLCGFQAKIKTTSDFGKAFLKEIDIFKIKKLLKTHQVVVVAGFQGIDAMQNLTTLGRGGSDTTAVALAAKLSCPCHIFSDVEGVFAANPSQIKNPKKLDNIFVDTMLEMASVGAKVLDTRCLEIAKKFEVPLFLGKSLQENKSKGTEIVMTKNFEQPEVTAICVLDDLCFFEISNEKNASKILSKLKEQNQNLQMFSCKSDVTSFLIAKNEAENVEKSLKNTFKTQKVKIFDDFCEISLVGFGFCFHTQIAEKLFQKLFQSKIFAESVMLTETKISLAIKKEQKQKTLEILTKLFEVTA